MPLTRHAGKRIPRDRDSRPLTPEEIARGEEVLSRVADLLRDIDLPDIDLGDLMKKSGYKGRTKPLTVPFEGEEVGITYYPARFTPNDAKAKTGDDEDGTVNFLARMLATADITDDHGKPVPITREELADWGYDLLNAIAKAIVSDIAPPTAAS